LFMRYVIFLVYIHIFRFITSALYTFLIQMIRPPPCLTLFPYTTLFRSVQLIDASQLYRKLRKNLGDKNCEFAPEHTEQILKLHRSEEHTSELQSRENLVCRLLLEKKKQK